MVPKSTNSGRLAQNIGVFDFELSREDADLVSGLDRFLRCVRCMLVCLRVFVALWLRARVCAFARAFACVCACLRVRVCVCVWRVGTHNTCILSHMLVFRHLRYNDPGVFCRGMGFPDTGVPIHN